MTYTRLWLLLIKLHWVYLFCCMVTDECDVEVLVKLWNDLWPLVRCNVAKQKHPYGPSELQAKRIQ